jgi:hypothetical protein
MSSQRHFERSRTDAGQPDVGLWHLGFGLLLVGVALFATVGIPRFPPQLAFVSHLVGDVSRAQDQVTDVSATSMPTLVDVELFFRSPSTSQLDAAGTIVSWVAWLLWLWLLSTTALRIMVVLTERATTCSRWSSGLRALSDRVTVPLVRRAVDASLAGELLLRAVSPASAAPAPATIRIVEYQQVQSGIVSDTLNSPGRDTWPAVTIAPDLNPGDVLYTVQRGDNLSGIAQRFYGDPAAFEKIVEANLGRGQPRGQTLRDARFIYPGWQLVIPEPTHSIHTDSDGERWYTVRAGDTLWGISARLLGDGQRYREVFADNQGAELGDGHVLTNPNLIWPGLHLRLPSDLPPDADAEPAAAVSPAAPSDKSEPIPMPVPADQEQRGQPTSSDDTSSNVAERSGNVDIGSAPVAAPVTEEAPVPTTAAEGPPAFWPPAWLPGDARTDLEIAGGLTAAALLALSARRRRRTPLDPESDTRLDVAGFTLAEPAAVVAGRSTGTGGDPHWIVLGELLAGELLRHARVAELEDVRVISVIGGRSGSVVRLAASVEDRPLLEAALRTETRLARRIEISRSPEQDILVNLWGVHEDTLGRVSILDCPVLLCLGMLPDSRSYLVGWEALGHVLVATQPGTTDAEEHLAALVATLAGQSLPSELQLFTVAGEHTWLRQLAPLPHQRAVVDPSESSAVEEMIAGLRAEVERRQRLSETTAQVEQVLVVSELANIDAQDDLAYLLSKGAEYGVRVLAATAHTDVEQSAVVDQFSSRIVFALQDEEASSRLLGAPWALTLAEPGRLLVQLGRRKELEVLGLHLSEDGRRDLLASTGVVEAAPAREEIVVGCANQGPIDAPESIQPDDPEHSVLEPVAASTEELHQSVVVAESDLPAESDRVSATNTSRQSEPAVQSTETIDTPQRLAAGDYSVAIQGSGSAAGALDVPPRITRLLTATPLVVDCDEASVWSESGRLDIGQSSPVEVLLYLAAAPLMHQGRLADWDGVDPDTLLAEIWAPRARSPENRDSGQTWLGKNLSRLEDEIKRAAGAVGAEIVVKRRGGLCLNGHIVRSDIEGFMAAVERARAAQGEEHIAAAEEAFATSVPGLLTRVVRKPRTAGPKVELYRWLGEPHWERAAKRLEALGREAGMLLGRAYRDGGRYDEALALYDQMLGDDPLDRRAREGLLISAAGTRDVVQLDRAWQQVCVIGGEDDAETRSLYDELRHRMNGNGSGGLHSRHVLSVTANPPPYGRAGRG